MLKSFCVVSMSRPRARIAMLKGPNDLYRMPRAIKLPMLCCVPLSNRLNASTAPSITMIKGVNTCPMPDVMLINVVMESMTF